MKFSTPFIIILFIAVSAQAQYDLEILNDPALTYTGSSISPESQAIKHQLDSFLIESYTSNDWENSLSYRYYYNENQKVEQYFRYSYTVSDEWINSAWYTYNYDTNEVLTERIHHSWDEGMQQWLISSKYNYSYNPDGTIAQVNIDYWDGSFWQENRRDTYTHDNDGNIIELIREEWNNDTEEWELAGKVEYTVANNVPVEGYYYGWDMFEQEWDNVSKYNYTYDALQNLSVYNISSWDNDLNQWVNFIQSENNYDNNYPYNELIIPFSEYSFRHKRTDFTNYMWDANTATWENNSLGTYFYSEQEIETNTSDFMAADFVIYPNPAKDFIVFDIKNDLAVTIKLYDRQGKFISTNTLKADNKLMVHHFPKGTYFYQLYNGEHQYSGKIVVE